MSYIKANFTNSLRYFKSHTGCFLYIIYKYILLTMIHKEQSRKGEKQLYINYTPT